jgi:eukaryotic-like serine/threonine-protein kinase
MSTDTLTPVGVVGQYNLLERLEPAGPGELYRARDTKHGRTVALRLLPSEFTSDQTAHATLIESARALVGLSHPNVITVFDVGEHEGRVYLAFEFLKGLTLRAEMAGRAMNVRRAVEIGVQISDALAHAHAAGFAHRGLSPESVVITSRGHAKIPAFELATRDGFEQGAADLRLVDYESPEEARGEPPDDRSDVYSVGAIVYEMLTARRPQHRGSAAPSAANSRVPEALSDIVLKAVAPNPDLRCQAAAALAADLRAVLAGMEAGSSTDAEAATGTVRSTGSGRRVALVIAILVVLVAVAWWLAQGYLPAL